MYFTKKNIILIAVISVFCMFSSCEIYNPEESIPSYLRIDTIKLQVTTGTNSSKITDAWVYIDDQPIGAFQLPAKFPVLLDGSHEVFIKAGIKVNGIGETRGAYPFFDGYTTNVNFVKDSVVSISPIVSYFPNAQFVLNEDFESSGLLFEKTSRSDTALEKTDVLNEVFDGDYSGVVHLTSSKNLFECKSLSAYKFSTGGKPVYVEMNYRTDNPFTIGIFANVYQNSIQHSVFVVNKSEAWNKIYINLSDAISRYPDAIDFNIFIGALLTEGQSDATIYFDNIRLIHN